MGLRQEDTRGASIAGAAQTPFSVVIMRGEGRKQIVVYPHRGLFRFPRLASRRPCSAQLK